jgi:Gpi18-like mannosyltransferase
MSLFLALAIMAFYAARKDRWRNAGLLLGLAALARPDGVLLGVGLAVEYFHQHKFSLKRDILWLACGPAAILGWMAYQWRYFGSPLAFVAVQKVWGAYTLHDLLNSPSGWVQLVGPILFSVLILIAIWNLRPGYSLFAITMLGVMLASPRYCSLARYIIVLFPAYMMLAIIGRRWRMVHRIYMVLAMLLSMLCMTRFALNLWLA